jgi:hypothetical protein
MNCRNNRTFLELEQLDRRDAPSVVLLSGYDPSIAQTSTTNGPITDVRLRRVVQGATVANIPATVTLTAGPVHAAQPTDQFTLNF